MPKHNLGGWGALPPKVGLRIHHSHPLDLSMLRTNLLSPQPFKCVGSVTPPKKSPVARGAEVRIITVRDCPQGD